MNLDDIKRCWEEHERSPFPSGLRGKSVEGVDLTLLESNLARYILGTIELGKPLAERSRGFLQTEADKLNALLPHLSGEAATYFKRLAKIAQDVLSLG